ncbi:hypothetical protein PENSTE_c018G00752 [Penicillium steckii]|uniref:RanBD1 domain-containing protein n=1 Tax=Penicillium steckii TaxID=303698 RepID=A0A1V6SWW8_9EURO|nr:hypothetical protein PENSTE_c018G00752 [Penicillium steckii]
MPKRLAEGPQGSKDDQHLFESNKFGMSSTPSDAPQRATAAQLASRKIKDVRRRPRGTTPSGGTEQPSNAFGGLSTPNFGSPSPSFGAPPAQPAQSSGFTFGQSQSFPGASSGSTQPSQSSSTPFSFGSGSQTGFNFGASSGASGSTSFNNPFANGSGNSAPAPATQSTSFTGFNFGGQTTSQPAQPSQPAFSFGAPQNANATSGSGIFGQSNTANSTSSPADSMQMSPDSKPNTSTTTPAGFQSRNIFGDSASNLFSPKPSTATPSSNPFGNLKIPSTAEKPASDKAEGISAKPAFAGQSTPASGQAAPFGNLFGASSTAAKPSEPEKPATTNLFGAGSTQSAFSGLSTPKPVDEQSSQNNLFAPKTTSDETPAKPADSNPFKNLFGASTAAQASGPQTPASTSQNLFSPKPTAEQSSAKPAEAQPFKNLFGGGATSTSTEPQQATAASTPSTNLFSSKPADESTDKPADATPFKNLFGATTKPSEASQEQTASAPNLFSSKPATDKAATNNLFAPKPAAEQTPEKPANANPFGSLMGASTSTPKPSEPESAKPQSTPAPNLFASSSTKTQTPTTPAAPFGNLFGAKSDAAPSASASAGPASTTPSFANAKPAAPAQIPKSSLSNSVGSTNLQLMKRIRLLDSVFKEEVSKYEPGADSFDGLIMHYMALRQAMGAPVGSQSEWKSLDAIPMTNGQVVKDSTTVNGTNDSATSNVFAQSFSSPAKSTEPAKAPSSSSTSPAKAPMNPFASLNTNASSSTKPAENPFAKISTTTQPAASPASAAKDTETSTPSKLTGNMFASPKPSNSQGLAAPPSVPKFGNGSGGVDFFAQFKKKAEEDEAKEKAKRKAEDFDSDEDDEEEWERRDAEKQREKRAKLEAASKQKAVFVPGKGFQFVDADEESNDSSESRALPAPSPAPSTGSIFDSTSQPVPASQNIFGRLSSATPQPADDGNDSDASDDAKPRSPKRRASGEGTNDENDNTSEHEAKRSKSTENGEKAKSSLDAPLPAPTAAAGRSLFDRIESPTPSFASPKPSTSGINFGASTTSNSANPFAASLGANSQTSQLFGASFNTGSSQPASTESPTPADNTWKPSTPIKFANDTNSTSAQASTEASAQTSGAENATSGAATPDEEGAPGSIFDMSSANAGEEEETVVLECRARAFKLTTGWVSQGTGTVRLLKHPGTNRARIVLRADPGGNVILNTLLKKELDYARTSNSVQFMVPQVDAKPEQWAIRVKAESIASLHDKIQEIKN